MAWQKLHSLQTNVLVNFDLWDLWIDQNPFKLYIYMTYTNQIDHRYSQSHVLLQSNLLVLNHKINDTFWTNMVISEKFERRMNIIGITAHVGPMNSFLPLPFTSILCFFYPNSCLNLSQILLHIFQLLCGYLQIR